MYNRFFTTAALLLLAFNGLGTANSVYHEFTMNSVGGGCGIFVNSITPTNNAPLNIKFTIDFQYFTNQARIYYTTDGSTPSAAFGVTSGTTQQVAASYSCSFNNGSGNVDVASGTIPGLPTGTVVKYIVSAWHSGGGLEIFASGGSNTSSASATVFTYTVGSVLPVSIAGFSGKKENSAVKLSWTLTDNRNTGRFEIYAADHSMVFKKIGDMKADGTTLRDFVFTHTSPVEGNNFYKINIIDKNGHVEFSPVIKVVYDAAKLPGIFVSGNDLYLRFNAAYNEPCIIILFNNAGQTLKKWSFSGSGNTSLFSFSIPSELKNSISHVLIKSLSSSFCRSVLTR